jgi:hypothetical protein
MGTLKIGKWGATEDLRRLYDWMKTRALANHLRLEKWEEWHSRVEKDRVDYKWPPVTQ